MPVIEKYEPGMFCWIELATNDAAAAKSFYTSLFGWTATTCRSPTAASTRCCRWTATTSARCTRTRSIPPNWASYVNVASVDDSAKKAQELGANAHRASVRRDGRRPHGHHRRSAGRDVLPLAGEEKHRRHDPRRIEHALLERADDARHRRPRAISTKDSSAGT